MSETEGLGHGAAELRRAFDASFALRPEHAIADGDDLLAIRVVDRPYALRLREITALVAPSRIVPVPAATPALLGVAAVRGSIVPVFALAALLGHGECAEPPTWMVLCDGNDPVGLAFRVLDGHLRLARDAIHDGLVSTDEGVRALVDLPAILLSIRSRSGERDAARER